MDKNIELIVKKTGLNGEIAVIKKGQEIKTIPALIFSEDEAKELCYISYQIQDSYKC